MTTKISPYLAQIPIGRLQPDGSVVGSTDFIRWANEQLIPRVGGSAAQSNLELAAAISAATAWEMVLQPIPAQQGFPDVTQPSAAEQSFPDVMQTYDASGFDEITFQH